MSAKNYRVDRITAPMSMGFEVVEVPTGLVVYETHFRRAADKRCSDLNKNRFGFNGFTPEYLLTPCR